MPFIGSDNDRLIAAADIVARRPARVIINPATVSGEPDANGVLPWGGTFLGRTVAGSVLHVQERVTPLRFWRGGGARPYAYHRGGLGEVLIRLDFAEGSGDVLQLAFPRMFTTPDTNDNVHVQIPGGRIPEVVAADGEETVSLAIIPHDLAKPALYLRAVVPHQDPERGLAWQIWRYGSAHVWFRALALAAGVPAGEEIGVIAPWAEITL